MTTIVHAAAGQRLGELTSELLTSSLAAMGAVLLRGFTGEAAEFKELTERLSAEFFTHGKRKVVLDDRTIEVVPGNERVAPHQELGYLPFRPDYLWLMCRIPAATGGRTHVIPAGELFARLSPETQRAFESTDIVYQHRWHEAMWRGYWPDVTLTDVHADLGARVGITIHADSEPGVLRFDYRTSALGFGATGQPLFLNSVLNMIDVMRKGDATAVVSWATGRPFTREQITELEQAAELVARPVAWQPHDVLLIDNHVVLHAREPFTGPRDVVVRIGARANWR